MDARGRGAEAAAGNVVYEDVQPQYTWVPGERETTLRVDLTGFRNEAAFKKEHLKIQTDSYGNIKVSGERPIGRNRWSRFEKVFHLPEDCDPSGIKATYLDGVLSVVVPKLARAQQPLLPPQPPKARAGTPSPKPPPLTPAKVRPVPSAKKEPQAQPVVPSAPAPAKPEDRKTGALPADSTRDTQQTATQKGKEPAIFPTADDRWKAAVSIKKEAEPAADGGRAPPAAEAAGGEKPGLGPAAMVGMVALPSSRRRLLVNVVVALVVLVGLGFYLTYWYRATPEDHKQPAAFKGD